MDRNQESYMSWGPRLDDDFFAGKTITQLIEEAPKKPTIMGLMTLEGGPFFGKGSTGIRILISISFSDYCNTRNCQNLFWRQHHRCHQKPICTRISGRHGSIRYSARNYRFLCHPGCSANPQSIILHSTSCRARFRFDVQYGSFQRS